MMKCLSSRHDHRFPDRGYGAFLSSGGMLGWCPLLICRVWRRVRSWFRSPRPSRWWGHLRARLDRSAVRGVPARVTVSYPFVPPEQITDAAVPRWRPPWRTWPTSTAGFAGTQWFGEDVLWLVPEPSAPFLAVTGAVHAAFPHYPRSAARSPR